MIVRYIRGSLYRGACAKPNSHMRAGGGAFALVFAYSSRHDGPRRRPRYADHVSIVKFIERNWHLPTITHCSRDNFPNPVQFEGSYAPVNAPALDDLFDFFDFRSSHGF
jgi:phospholipase C